MTPTLHDNSELLSEEKLDEPCRKNLEYLDFGNALDWLLPEDREMLDDCEWLGTVVRQHADVLVVIGVGGSNRAARAVYECLGSKSGS